MAHSERRPERGSRGRATDTTFWFGFKDDVAIRIRADANGGSLVDVRSVSRVGGSDLGANAARIERFSSDSERSQFLECESSSAARRQASKLQRTVPIGLIIVALATVFVFPRYDRGQFYRNTEHDDISADHLAIAANLSSKHGFAQFLRRRFNADGELTYEAYHRFPLLGDVLIQAGWLACWRWLVGAPLCGACARVGLLRRRDGVGVPLAPPVDERRGGARTLPGERGNRAGGHFAGVLVVSAHLLQRRRHPGSGDGFVLGALAFPRRGRCICKGDAGRCNAPGLANCA